MTGTERKVLNKYYPPDFDPRKIPKGRFEPNRQYVIRVMAPFNMQCNTCGEYIYKGKKFNARRETVTDDDYLGLSLFRFYIRCPRCLAEITFKTDLKNCDYSQEHGAMRLFEAEKLLKQEEQKIQQQEDEDKTNPMKMLEKRTKMSRFEMDALERLEELKDMNQRKLKPDYESIIDEITKEQQLAREKQEKEDEDFVSAIFGKTEDGKVVKRIFDDEEDDPNLPVCSKMQKNFKERDKNPAKKAKFSNQKSILSTAIIKKSSQILQNDDEICIKTTENDTKVEKSVANLHKNEEKSPKNGLNLLSAYANSSDSD